MSRSGFYEADDCDQEQILSMGRTMGRIASATRGRRGQKFLKLALKALDDMEDKRLAGGTFGVSQEGCMCLMSSIATQTGRADALSDIPLDDGSAVCDSLAGRFDVAAVMVKSLVWENDENAPHTPAMRWSYMRRFISNRIDNTCP